MKLRRLAPVALATALLASASIPARAATYYDYAHANLIAALERAQIEAEAVAGRAQTLATEAAINQVQRVVGDDIISALRNFSGQQSLDTTAAEQAASNREDIKDAREVTRRVEDARQQAINAVRGGATSCNVITGLMGGSALFAQSAQWQKDMTSATLDYMAGSTASTASSRGPGPGREQRINAICQTNATQEMINQGVCAPGSPLENRPTNGGPARPGSALDANIFLSNSVMSAAESDASKLFMATAFAATPLGALPPGIGTTEEGREIISTRQATLARQSIAQGALSSIIGARTAANLGTAATVTSNGSTGGSSSTPRVSLQEWMEGTSKRMIGYNPNGGNFPNGVSRQAWNEIRARSWYLDPQFQQRIGNQDANQNSKDIASMISFMVYMEYENSLKFDMMNSLLAGTMGILEEMNRRQAQPAIAN